MIDYSFQTLHSDGGARVIFRGVVGSRAYGTDRPGSDEDVRGVFLVPPLEYALLAAPPEQVADERNDRVYYSLRRFAELAAASNPNALELFWLPRTVSGSTRPASPDSARTGSSSSPAARWTRTSATHSPRSRRRAAATSASGTREGVALDATAAVLILWPRGPAVVRPPLPSNLSPHPSRP